MPTRACLIVDPAGRQRRLPAGGRCGRRRAQSGRCQRDSRRRLRLLEPMRRRGSDRHARGWRRRSVTPDAAARRRTAMRWHGDFAFEAPIVVCLGNPPYKRQRQGGPARQALLSNFFDPGAGRHAKNLYNDYVYFWRWALRAVFEQRVGPGIVSFVTAASYLRGPAFAGMRRLLRQVLDELWILDLEGDSPRRTEDRERLSHSHARGDRDGRALWAAERWPGGQCALRAAQRHAGRKTRGTRRHPQARRRDMAVSAGRLVPPVPAAAQQRLRELAKADRPLPLAAVGGPAETHLADSADAGRAPRTLAAAARAAGRRRARGGIQKDARPRSGFRRRPISAIGIGG